MRRSRKHVLPVFAMLVASSPVFSQTAPQRSEELCVAIQPTALENARRFEFDVMRSGACRVNIDNGYDLFVTYDDRALHLAIGVNLGLLNGDGKMQCPVIVRYEQVVSVID